MPREVYTFTYKDYDYHYLPLAPVRIDNKTKITEVFTNTFEIFNKNNKSAGNIFFSGQSTIVPNKKLLNPKLYNESVTIYFNEDNIKNISYIRYDAVIFQTEKQTSLPYTQKATATGGRFAGKNVTITQELLGNPEDSSRLQKIIIDY